MRHRIVFAALVLLAGCGSANVETNRNASEIDSGTGSVALPGADLGAVVPVASAQFLGESARRTEEVSTGTLTFVMTIEGSAGFDGEVLRLEQQFDTQRNRASYTLTPSQVFGELSGFGERQGIIVGDVVYLKSPTIAEELGVRTAWLRYEDPCGASDVTAGLPFGGTDAATVLEALGAVGEVTEVGTEDIDGRRAKHYRSEADLGATGDEDDACAEAPLSSLVAPVDVWIDENDGFVLRIEIRAGLADLVKASGEQVPRRAESLLRGTVVLALSFRDLGVPVTIREPIQSQVTEVTKADVELAEAAIAERANGFGGVGSP
ncbi:MAG: hypothetical protein N2037_02265 [Acidimicrobiales bacterium]|nr:hypothetical protein [Acidimicrobiales bacterium]